MRMDYYIKLSRQLQDAAVLPRGLQHSYYYTLVIIVAGIEMRERQRKLHVRIIETYKREVASHD